MPSARSFDEAWSDLTTIIKLGKRLRLVMVECADEAVQAALREKIRTYCAAHGLPFSAPPDGADRLAWLVDQQRASAEIPIDQRDVVQPVRFFPVPTGQDETFTLYRLNENRDNLKRDLRGVLVLAGLEDFLRRVPLDAPDLWSMREDTFEVAAQALPPFEGAPPSPRHVEGSQRWEDTAVLEETVDRTLLEGVPSIRVPQAHGDNVLQAQGYEAFLSYAYRDREVAEEMRMRLEKDGVQCLMADPSEPPDPKALVESRFFVPLLSPDWVDSRWPGIAEALRSTDEEALAQRTLPVLVRPLSRLPGYLKRFEPLQWTTEEQRSRSYPELLRVLQGRGRELPASAVDVFLSHATEDEALAGEFETHLSSLKREGAIRAWHRGGITASEDWRRAIDELLSISGVALVLVLVSADYLASDYLYNDELKRALDWAHRGEARVIPVIVRTCNWEPTALGGLAALPKGRKPITSWQNRDEAWTEVERGIREALATRTPHNLRARNPYFRGRAEELVELERALRWDKAATITHASVFGLGGVGKTALALELAHRAVDKGTYPGGVWWVAAEGNPVDALVSFAPELRASAPAEVRARLSEAETRAEVIADDVRLALQGQKAASLLVLDNVSEQGWRQLIPEGAVRVLMTTRDENLAIGLVRRLEVLTREQACEVAEAIVGETRDKAEVEARDRVLVTELDGLAVAVEMAARAVKRWFHGSWAAYERVLRTEMGQVLEDPKLYGEYGRGVFAAIDLSIDRCDAEGRALLEGAAVLAPEAMPREWALGAAGIKEEGLAAARAMAGLKELGLITVDEEKGVVSMHRLVHRRVQARAEAEHKEAWDAATGRAVECVATWIGGAVRLDQTRAEMEAVDARREHIDRALGIAQMVGSEPAWIWIADGLATHLNNRARYDESLVLYQRALVKAEKLTPPNPARVAASLANLAMLHRNLGQSAAARPLLERAIAIEESTYGPDHPVRAKRLSSLAGVHKDLGQPAAARPLMERALAINEATYGPDHPIVATSLSNLALVHKDLGQPAAARPLLERALAIDEATYGPDHPAVATDLSNLATVHRALGQHADARPLAERALHIAEATYGPDHPIVALRLSNLAAVHHYLGQAAAARPLLERAIAIAEAHLPPDHPYQALFRHNLAALASLR